MRYTYPVTGGYLACAKCERQRPCYWIAIGIPPPEQQGPAIGYTAMDDADQYNLCRDCLDELFQWLEEWPPAERSAS